jgi:hypothetical protein
MSGDGGRRQAAPAQESAMPDPDRSSHAQIHGQIHAVPPPGAEAAAPPRRVPDSEPDPAAPLEAATAAPPEVPPEVSPGAATEVPPEAATVSPPGGGADLPPAALRALAEAEARRRRACPAALPPELGGRDGPEPVRFGDWELKGLAIDF